MGTRDYRDVYGGGALTIVGVAAAAYVVATLEIGSLRNMGPGAFPAVLSVILAIFGVSLAVPALLRSGPAIRIRLWTPLFVLFSIVAFALVIRPFGLIPAILTVTIISSFAELKVRPVSLLVLCVVLSGLGYLIFMAGLGLPIPAFNWPF